MGRGAALHAQVRVAALCSSVAPLFVVGPGRFAGLAAVVALGAALRCSWVPFSVVGPVCSAGLAVAVDGASLAQPILEVCRRFAVSLGAPACMCESCAARPFASGVPSTEHPPAAAALSVSVGAAGAGTRAWHWFLAVEFPVSSRLLCLQRFHRGGCVRHFRLCRRPPVFAWCATHCCALRCRPHALGALRVRLTVGRVPGALVRVRYRAVCT